MYILFCWATIFDTNKVNLKGVFDTNHEKTEYHGLSHVNISTKRLKKPDQILSSSHNFVLVRSFVNTAYLTVSNNVHRSPISLALLHHGRLKDMKSFPPNI